METCERYEMVRLPDSLVPTTIFVGNLCEFVTDDMLSTLFQEVSSLLSVPACVARKANANSLKYGFVTFVTAEEKEAAILRFNGYELNGRPMKVEEIIDKPGCNRVRVPEKLVAYTVGAAKKTRDGKKNTLRRVSRDDVERLSRGQPAKKRGYGSRGVPHRLNENERGAFERAARNGFVTLDGTGYRRGRKGSPLANIHRQWCDARAKPQIVLCKASGGRPLDNVIVDFSPLRIGALSPDRKTVDGFLTSWKADVLMAACEAGMTLKTEYEEDNSEQLDVDSEEETVETRFVITVDSAVTDAWATEPIWRLPSVSIGVFEGERSKAKAMAKRLAELWEVKDDAAATGRDGGGAKSRRSAGARGGGRTKTKGLREYRRQRRKNDQW